MQNGMAPSWRQDIAGLNQLDQPEQAERLPWAFAALTIGAISALLWALVAFAVMAWLG